MSQYRYLILSFVGTCLISGVPVLHCPSDWLQHVNSCYTIQQRKVSWYVAEITCVALHSYLLEVNTLGEANFLKRTLNATHVNDSAVADITYWTGGNDFVHNGNWQWANSENNISLFTDWSPGEPNNALSIEDCVELNHVNSWSWNDRSCDHKNYFICERPISPSENVPGIIG